MITAKAHFDGRVFVPDEPVTLPVGCELEISIPSPPTPVEAKSPLPDLATLFQQYDENPDWPADGAAQHDHYLYGTCRRP